MAVPDTPGPPEGDPPPAPEPIVLKNRIAVLTPEPIAEGAFGQVFVGKILNPVGLLAERVVWGEESPRWLGLDDIPFQEPPKDETRGWLPTPILDPGHRKRVYEAADRLWSEYLARRRQDRARAQEEYRDFLNLIDPLLDEDRIIAVKVLRPPVENDPELDAKIVEDSVRRFIRENDLLRALRHPGIVRRFGLVKDAKMGWCLLLEYIEGETLDAFLRRRKDHRLPPAEALDLVRQVAEALRYVHARGIIHRDLKPQNVMVRKDDGRAVLMDFGIGKWTGDNATQALTMSGMRVGTPRYMAPEQARAEGPIGGAADVYALATILFELLTGRAAYEGLDYEKVFQWLLDPARRHPSALRDLLPAVSRDLEALVEIGREKDPARRWGLEEFLQRAGEILAAKDFEITTASLPETPTELEQALRETRMRKKELAWEEHVLGTRLHYVDLQSRVQEAWTHLEKKAYLDARAVLESLRTEMAALPAGRESLRADFENLEKAYSRASARHEAESLLGLAEQHAGAQRYVDAGSALDAASKCLEQLPRDGYSDIHSRYRRLAEPYDAQHRAFVDLFTALRKSFVEKIQERYRDLHDRYGKGEAIDAARIPELLQQIDTAQRNLRTIDREKVGPAVFDGAQRDLAELKVALEDLLRRSGSPA
jgi:serine/threonine protein kinase